MGLTGPFCREGLEHDDYKDAKAPNKSLVVLMLMVSGDDNISEQSLYGSPFCPYGATSGICH